MRYVLLFVGLPLLWASLPVHAHATLERPIVAVMDIEFVGLKPKSGMAERLTILLTGRLGATERFQVVPRDQVKLRLVEMKKESYASDCDASCQIELGKRVAARKSITTQVVRAGSRCTVTLNVFDLKRETSEGGASMTAGCDEDAIVASLDAIIAQISAPAQGLLPSRSAIAPQPDRAPDGLAAPAVARKPEPLRTAGITLLSLGGAVVAGGLASAILADQDRKRFTQRQEAGASASELDGITSRQRQKAIAGYSLLGGGGAMVLTGAALLIARAVRGAETGPVGHVTFDSDGRMIAGLSGTFR